MPATSLSLRPDPEDPPPHTEPPRTRTSVARVLFYLLLAAGLGGGGYVIQEQRRRIEALERQAASAAQRAEEAARFAREATERAASAEVNAQAAAQGRQVAEAETATARSEADTARQEATTAKQTAEQAKAEAEAVRKRAEADIQRLEGALGQIAETRRTALGVVMNLGSDYLKFEFNKADLRPEDRELLSRVAGILMTARDYTVSVVGHTDDVGSEAYNKTLSLRRAETVRDFLVKSGLPAAMFTVDGEGKSRPLVPGTSDAARAKNRRVELGIVNTQIKYLR